MSKLYDNYNYLKSTDFNSSNTLYLFKVGIFFIFLDKDAQIASTLLNLKITQLNSHVIKCGFPINSFEKYKILLNNSKYNFKIVDQQKNTSFSISEYSLDNNISNLLLKINKINPESLSVKQAYDFINELKEDVYNIKNSTK